MFFKSKILFVLTFNAAKIQKIIQKQLFFSRKVVFISKKKSILTIFLFIDQSFALLTYDFQCFFVTLQPKL